MGVAAYPSLSRSDAARPRPRSRHADAWFGWALLVLGVGLTANTVLGPWITDTIRYPFSDSLRNQTIGLEAVSLLVVAPLCIAAGVLARRGHRAGPVLAFGPAAYTAYVLLQYIIGPGYLHYPRVLPFHLGLFVLSMIVGIKAWTLIDDGDLPAGNEIVASRRSIVVLALGAFIVLRYLPALAGSWTNKPIAPEFTNEPAMYWSILALDLGLVVPSAVAIAVGLRRAQPAATKGLYALLGWFALVPPSVAAMAAAMVINDDPNGSAQWSRWRKMNPPAIPAISGPRRHPSALVAM